MRHIAFLGLVLTLAGCGLGYGDWNPLPFTNGTNPNLPAGDSENMRRVMGDTTRVAPLTPEPGDVWPGPIKPPPTLEDLETQSGQPEQPLPPVGSSTPQGPPLQQFPPLPSKAPSATLPPISGVPTPKAPQPGQVVQTGKGAGVISGGTGGYQTLTTPGGGQSIVVPNGNGTSTIIHPDGTVETVPTPK